MSSPESVFNKLLSKTFERSKFSGMADWFASYKSNAQCYESIIDASIIGGRQSRCMGFAFASGYQSAIQHLFNERSVKLASLCVTELGGNHPRSIETTLTEQSGSLIVSGHKTFISGAKDAELMFVACRDMRSGNGFDAQGRPVIKIVRIPVQDTNIDITEMPALGFVPEISHGSVALNDVLVTSNAVLCGDGYLDYVKAFRTYEDLHVLTAITAFRLAEAVEGDWPTSEQEAYLSLLLALRALSELDLSNPHSHIGLSACRTQLHELISRTDALFESSNPEGFSNWQRDRKLLSVAQKAHQKRTENAWKAASN